MLFQSKNDFAKTTRSLAFVLCGTFAMSAWGHAEEQQKPSAEIKVANLRMYLRVLLSPSVLADLTKKDAAHFVVLTDWEDRPAELHADLQGRQLRARSERDHIAIWVHGDKAEEDAEPTKLFHDATRSLLAEPYRCSDFDKIELDVRSPVGPDSRLRMATIPHRVPNTNVLFCSYTQAKRNHEWGVMAEEVYLLVSDRDVIVCVKKLIPRQSTDEVTHEGITALKAHRAADVIFPKGTPKGIPSELLKACIWASEKNERQEYLGPFERSRQSNGTND